MFKKLNYDANHSSTFFINILFTEIYHISIMISLIV